MRLLVIADRNNCRILFVNPSHRSRVPVRVWGHPGDCTHHVTSPPLTFGYPDAAFVAKNGDIVVTEQSPAWVDVLSPSGTLVSQTSLAGFGDPSDANQYQPGYVIVTDRSKPGKVVEFNYTSPTASVSPKWSYQVASGAGALDLPTEAIVLPGGDVLVADSGNDRIVVIDPTTNLIVWQYGHTHAYGRAAGYLHTPESVALVPNASAG